MNIIKPIFNFLQSRPMMIVLGLASFLFTLSISKHLFIFLHDFYGVIPTDTQMDHIEELLSFYANLMVTIGVYLETREILQKQTNNLKADDKVNHFLNEVAETNGSGLLIIGLILECLSYTLIVPNSYIDTSGIEWYIILTCFISILLIIPIATDLVVDYIKSYFTKDLK